jgi:hypothetical protein
MQLCDRFSPPIRCAKLPHTVVPIELQPSQFNRSSSPKQLIAYIRYCFFVGCLHTDSPLSPPHRSYSRGWSSLGPCCSCNPKRSTSPANVMPLPPKLLPLWNSRRAAVTSLSMPLMQPQVHHLFTVPLFPTTMGALTWLDVTPRVREPHSVRYGVAGPHPLMGVLSQVVFACLSKLSLYISMCTVR